MYGHLWSCEISLTVLLSLLAPSLLTILGRYHHVKGERKCSKYRRESTKHISTPLTELNCACKNQFTVSNTLTDPSIVAKDTFAQQVHNNPVNHNFLSPSHRLILWANALLSLTVDDISCPHVKKSSSKSKWKFPSPPTRFSLSPNWCGDANS